MSSDRTPLAEDTGERRIVANVSCLACGCRCDDLTVSLVENKVTDVAAACLIGRDWFIQRQTDTTHVSAQVDGQAVDLDKAIERAIGLLSSARSPILWGLRTTSTESVRAALALADRVGARVVIDRSVHEQASVAAFQAQGRVTATLGEVKNRADLVVFWGTDPLTTHPRHWERYSVEPHGRFVPEGRAGRTVIVVDHERTRTAERADVFIPIPRERQVEALLAIRRFVQGHGSEQRATLQAVGLDPLALESLANRLLKARYGALFFQTNGSSGLRSEILWESAARLVRDLNERTRFVILGMGDAGNLNGAEAALTWQSGFLQGVDYRLGRPIPLDEGATLDDALQRREVDLMLAISDRCPADLSPEAADSLRTIPSIVIGPRATEPSDVRPTVAIATSTAGFDATGTVMRSDGIVLPLRPVNAPRRPSDGDLIERLSQGVVSPGSRPS